ncbi:MAG: hypothetical protein AAGD32_02160 [Planctomycetota bacterium]
MKTDLITRGLIVVAVAVILLVGTYSLSSYNFYLSASIDDLDPTTPAEELQYRALLGDSFGIVNATLSLLAFLGVVAALTLQRRELDAANRSSAIQELTTHFYSSLTRTESLRAEIDASGSSPNKSCERSLVEVAREAKDKHGNIRQKVIDLHGKDLPKELLADIDSQWKLATSIAVKTQPLFRSLNTLVAVRRSAIEVSTTGRTTELLERQIESLLDDNLICIIEVTAFAERASRYEAMSFAKSNFVNVEEIRLRYHGLKDGTLHDLLSLHERLVPDPEIGGRVFQIKNDLEESRLIRATSND